MTTYIKGWFDLKRAFYVHDCRGELTVPWPFDVILGAILGKAHEVLSNHDVHTTMRGNERPSTSR